MIPYHPVEEERCEYCNRRKAVWFYIDGRQACDDCVPRGCSCNERPSEDWDGEDEYTGEWTEDVDEQGRKFPCCEWLYDEGEK